jgi:6-pyruvoyl tetrahydropterin synthase/QueD family protein
MAYATVIKRGKFDSAHSNVGFGEGHKCARVHGHTFQYEVAVRSVIDKATGLSLDFGEVKNAMKSVELQLDHYYLNEVPPFNDPEFPPSAENIAIFIITMVQKYLDENVPLMGEVQYVILNETPTSAVRINREDL